MTSGDASLGAELNSISERLAGAGSESSRLDGRLLVAHALGLEMGAVLAHPERILGPNELARIHELVERRLAHEPMAHILCVKEFWSLPFQVDKHTLTPRPDSESLIEAVLDWLGGGRLDEELDILDMGTGSGALLLALLSELPRARGLGTDISPEALALARRNARALELDGRAGFALGDWGAGLDRYFHIILANPPYVAGHELASLPPEIRLYEPLEALDGGPDGLDEYRRLVPQAGGLLHPRGGLFLEVGRDMAPKVAEIMTAQGFIRGGVRQDLARIERVVWATRDEFNTAPANKSFCKPPKSAT